MSPLWCGYCGIGSASAGWIGHGASKDLLMELTLWSFVEKSVEWWRLFPACGSRGLQGSDSDLGGCRRPVGCRGHDGDTSPAASSVCGCSNAWSGVLSGS